MGEPVRILSIKAREVLDSRGNPTVEAEVRTKFGLSRAIVPSGASTGKFEALELRDGGKRYSGMGVLNAVNNVNKIISKKLSGKDVSDQYLLDNMMIQLDGTPNKSKLGANAILAVSMACLRAAANAKGKPLYEQIASTVENKKLILPIPCFNIINGGKHAGTKLDVQEYMLIPTGAKTFAQALQIGSEVYHELKKIIEAQFGKTATNVGDEGGFTPPVEEINEPLDLISKAVENLGYQKQVKYGIDFAATTFVKNGRYYIEGSEHGASDLIERYSEIISNYPIFSIEDPLAEEDWSNWTKLTSELGNKVHIIGDDLLVTNQRRIEKAMIMDACNGLLLKVNQIGTVTEAIEAGQLANTRKWITMVSHRSGETEDDFISDLAVGLGNGLMKSGATARGERTAKYNRLLRIEEELGKKAKLFRW